jgi:hypothetical protein
VFGAEAAAYVCLLLLVSSFYNLRQIILDFIADLESLFVDSDEVKRELPEATQRFARIDAAIQSVLKVRGGEQVLIMPVLTLHALDPMIHGQEQSWN